MDNLYYDWGTTDEVEFVNYLCREMNPLKRMKTLQNYLLACSRRTNWGDIVPEDVFNHTTTLLYQTMDELTQVA